MHMPGHKRNPLVMPYGIPMGSDITEIDGFDNLHSPEGVIRSIEQRAAALWGSRDAFISVNGATALIQSAILSSTKRGDKILVSSNCHISVWHAIELGGLIPVTVSPERSDDLPFMLGMPAKPPVDSSSIDRGISSPTSRSMPLILKTGRLSRQARQEQL